MQAQIQRGKNAKYRLTAKQKQHTLEGNGRVVTIGDLQRYNPRADRAQQQEIRAKEAKAKEAAEKARKMLRENQVMEKVGLGGGSQKPAKDDHDSDSQSSDSQSHVESPSDSGADADAPAAQKVTLRTEAKACKVSGQALEIATLRQPNTFCIEAFSASARQERGGDIFLVTIRGCGCKVRAKVTDVGDGTYTVCFKPEVAGKYAISISLASERRLRGELVALQEPLPGSPYRCVAQASTPCAARCILRGDALQTAIAGYEGVLTLRAGAARPEIEKREALEDLDAAALAALQRAVSQMSQR